MSELSKLPGEKPILFSAPMVRAILDDRKTQTRRIVSESARIGYPAHEITFACPGYFTTVGAGSFSWKCPYGAPGTRLWVRETFMVWKGGAGGTNPDSVIYADDPEWGLYLKDRDNLRSLTPDPARGNWHIIPSIHMPRWASRITLEVTGVRVERLQDISEEDIASEGVDEQLVKSVIDPIALRANAKPEHWIGGYDEGFGYCRKCAEKKVRELKKKNPTKEYYVDGGWPTEGDSQAFCESCHRVLDNSFTTYACESELDHFKENGWSLSPLDCLSLQNILGSYGWTDSERRDPKDLLAPMIHRIGWQAVWQSINGPESWAANPWVWIVEFRRIKP